MPPWFHGTSDPTSLLHTLHLSQAATIYLVKYKLTTRAGYWYSILYILGIDQIIPVTSSIKTFTIIRFLHLITAFIQMYKNDFNGFVHNR